FGSRLFKAIFKDEVWDCLSKSLHETNRQEEIGLRIRLRLLDAPQLADVPWEYLYIPAHKRFLALSVDTPIVRYLRLSEGIKPLSVSLPLNVLVMISNAKDYPSLDVNREWDKLKEALCDLEHKGLIKLELLESATLSALQHQLRNDEYHVFHFIGHGGFDNQTQEGVLILEDEEGNGRKVNGQKLGTILHDEQTLRLVVLNACEGARTSPIDPFAGTAQSLVQQGIPAVIAMQFEITDKAAITLSHTFYESIAEGYPVDYSLAEARKAINSEQDFNSVEWGTPVLYMRSSDGHIFDIDQIPILKNEAKDAMENKDWKTAITRWQAALDIDKDSIEAKRGLKRARWMKYRLRLWIGISALTLALAGVIFVPKIFPSKSIDLRIDSISIPSTVMQGDSVQLIASIHNFGNAPAKDVLVEWWPDDADTTVYVDSISEIDSKLTNNIGFTHPGYPHPGEFITRLTVNVGGDERDYSQIDSSLTIAVLSPPPDSDSVSIDLEIVDLLLEPSNPTVERPVTLRVAVRNIGDLDATNFIVKWCLDENYDYTVPEEEGGPIARGDTTTVELISPRGYEENGQITSRVEVTSVPDEGDYLIDDSTMTIEVSPISNNNHNDTTISRHIPDSLLQAELSVKNVEVTAYDGESVTVMITIENTGGADANSVEVLFAPGPVGRLQPRTISVDRRDSTSVEFAASFERTNESVKARIIVHYHGVQVDRCEHTWNPEAKMSD
ncbi:MAG: CHAT domain-containing protein, partial [Actinomycetia bacterium]|nr:CHAT domain-containing protein [Actinomycetes bacterium]